MGYRVKVSIIHTIVPSFFMQITGAAAQSDEEG
jgi:hypothetical protein